MPWATSVSAPQVSECNHQHFHDHSDCECVEKSQYLGRSRYASHWHVWWMAVSPPPPFSVSHLSVVFLCIKCLHEHMIGGLIHPPMCLISETADHSLIKFINSKHCPPNLILNHTGHTLMSVNFLRNSWLYKTNAHEEFCSLLKVSWCFRGTCYICPQNSS
jgi:hypothetical protein